MSSQCFVIVDVLVRNVKVYFYSDGQKNIYHNIIPLCCIDSAHSLLFTELVYSGGGELCCGKARRATVNIPVIKLQPCLLPTLPYLICKLPTAGKRFAPRTTSVPGDYCSFRKRATLFRQQFTCIFE